MKWGKSDSFANSSLDLLDFSTYLPVIWHFQGNLTLKMQIKSCDPYHTTYDKAIVDICLNFLSTLKVIKK